jgi:hypothetical protein
MDQQQNPGNMNEGDVMDSEGPSLEPEGSSSLDAEPEAPAPEVAETSETYNNITNKASEVTSNIKETATNAVNTLNNFRNTSSGSIIVMTIVGILVVAAIAIMLYYIIQYTMISQTSYLLVETSVPVLATNITLCDGSAIPNPSSGVRSGMCFWIYIYDISKNQGSIRHVFHRGTSTDTFNTGGNNKLPVGPYVALDPTTSAMSILFGPATGPTTNGSVGNYFKYNMPVTNGTGTATTITDNTLSGVQRAPGSLGSGPASSPLLTPSPSQMWQVASQSRGIVFPYIPLQRWVHVACVINENLNGGTITGYVDAELAVSVDTTTKLTPVDVTSSSGGTRKVIPVSDISNIDLSNTGDVYVGGSPSDPIGVGFSGLVSNIQFYNYDISAQDVYANYQKGPFNNPLAALGLPAYGVRSPIYQIGG